VVVPAFNAERYVVAALESALAQTSPVDEILVLDDGSTDATATRAACVSNKVRVISQANLGVSAARNRGIAEARGDVLAFLDADDTWEPAKIERQLPLLNQTTDAVHCAAVLIDSEGRPIGKKESSFPRGVATGLLLFDSSVTPSALVARTETLRRMGGFDTRLSTSADWDLAFRIAVRTGLGYVRDPLIRYRIHDSNMHADVSRMERDMLLAFSKTFATDDPAILRLRKHAYGRLHVILAGSYFARGERRRAIEHAARALTHRPSLLPELLARGHRRLRGGGRP
jgi:glycosyltransferase involved in cell wall biosynthesis